VITFDPDTLRKRLGELEQAMGEPGFWDDQARAAGSSSEHARLARRLERYDALSGQFADARELLELDPGMEDEIAASLGPLQDELARLQEDALFTGEYDAGPAVVTIHAGTGGTDAQDWAEILLRMYLRWAADRGFQTELVEASEGEEAGLKSATFTVHGENAYGVLKAERGVHRLVRQSPFDQAHRRHTSFAEVIVAPLLADDVDVEIADDDLRIDTYRASGAGGQHVNKTDSAIRITHLPTGVVVECQDERSQHKNRSRAMSLLKARLMAAERERRDKAEAQSRKLQVGSGDRSERIRTYNFPQGRVTDHRINLTLYKIERIMDGDLDELLSALAAEHQAEQLAQLGEEAQAA
jgi:peptide chain release factor 2